MFVDFHTRSAFSFLEGASLPEDLVQRAAELDHGAMALMDRDNVSGAPRFYMAAKKIGQGAHRRRDYGRRRRPVGYTAPMRALVQRVTQARVEVDGQVTGEIGKGLLVLLGVAKPDTSADAEFVAEKVVNLRIFPDDAGKMNLSLQDAGGALLVVSQFTLYGDCRKGRRPSFDAAAGGEQARSLYERFVEAARRTGTFVATGIFQADMKVSLTNDGPVTLLVESVPDKNG